MKRNFAVSLLVFTGILWSTGGFILKLIPWSPLAIAGIRSGVASILLYYYDKPKSISFGNYTILGSFFYTTMVICFVIANKMTSAGNVILIQYAAPIYVALFGFYFLQEKSSKIDWIAIIIIFFGLVSFFYDEISLDGLQGKAFALLSGVGFAGLTICMRKQKNGNPIHSVLIGNIFTFIACSPSYFNGIVNKIDFWSLTIFLGVIQLGLSYIFYSIAIRHVTALDAIIYPVIEPIFNPVFAYFIIDESMSINSIIGGFFILLGVTGRGLLRKKQKL